MSNSQNQAQFFGLDLRSLWRDCISAWSAMLEWPVISWLWPRSNVGVWLPDGTLALNRGIDLPLVVNASAAKSARFVAVLLPEDMLLRCGVRLPQLQPAELESALRLEIQARSPFAADDLISAHEEALAGANGIQANIILASRRLIAQYLKANYSTLDPSSHEVWVPGHDGKGFVVLPGFGESLRQRQGVVWRWVSATLVLIAIALAAAIALTPTAQSYLRTMQANQAMQALVKNAGPVVEQREAFTRSADQLASLSKLVSAPISPQQILSVITDALPDDTSLTALKIEGLKVSLTGQTANAAALMKHLGGTAGLRDVKAPTPATKPLGAPHELFIIEFTLDPAKLEPAT